MEVLQRILALLAGYLFFVNVNSEDIQENSEAVEACTPEFLTHESISKAIHHNYEELNQIMSGLESCIDAEFKLGAQSAEKLKNEISNVKRELSELSGLIHLIESDLSVVDPAFEWAQSADSIFIGVKFAHKLDTPACIDVVNEDAKITEKNIEFTANCRGKKKKFSLILKLWDEIDPKNSSWSSASVGRGVFTLTKKKAGTKWDTLLRTKTMPRNMHTWWELNEKYEGDFKNVKKEINPSRGEDIKPAHTDEVKTLMSDVASEEEKDKQVEADEANDEDAKRKKQERKKAKKFVKSERSKLKKQKKSKLKELDNDLKDSIAALEKRFGEKKQLVTDEIDRDIQKLKSKLEETLKQIDESASPSDQEESGILSKLTSFFSSSKDKTKEDL